MNYHGVPSNAVQNIAGLIYKFQAHPSEKHLNQVEDKIIELESIYRLDGANKEYWYQKLAWCQERYRTHGKK